MKILTTAPDRITKLTKITTLINLIKKRFNNFIIELKETSKNCPRETKW